MPKRMKLPNSKAPFFAIAFILLSCFYTNCSGFQAPSEDSASFASSSTGNCDADLLSVFQSSVQPFFRSTSTCIGCHIEGGVGIGAFASSDVNTSFGAFNGSGFAKVQYMATNPQHKPPFTGIQNQPAMDKIGTVWNAAQTQHLSCVSKLQNGGVDNSLLTAPKVAPSIYTAQVVKNAAGVITSVTSPTQTLTWDLSNGSDLDAKVTRSIGAKITIDVKVLYQIINNVATAKGYVFSNPQMALKATGQQVVVEGLFFQINGRAIDSQTTFTNLSRVVSGTSFVPLMTASGNTLIEPIGTSDTFQLYLTRIIPTDASDGASAPLTPILSLQDTMTGSNQFTRTPMVNTFILRDSGILRWCLSESPTAPVSTEAACVNSMTGPGIVNGWFTQRPTSFTLSAAQGAKPVYLWVANESLLINTSPAQVNITLDSVAPLAPAIGTITVTDTQVADMSVTHPNVADVAGWCVFEQNIALPVPGQPKLDDPCWKWTDLNAKPTTVGFKGNGSRDVRVYVRDQAGNVSAASNVVRASNPLNAITYSDLIGTNGTNTRSIFQNRCIACHGSSSLPGYSKLHLFDYESTLADVQNGTLNARINNVISPMPNISGGLMPQRERDLIRLWTMPEEGKDPLE
jgi:hypothetical protein